MLCLLNVMHLLLCAASPSWLAIEDCDDAESQTVKDCDCGNIGRDPGTSYQASCETVQGVITCQCDDVNECLQTPSVCPVGKTCNNENGGYNCISGGSPTWAPTTKQPTTNAPTALPTALPTAAPAMGGGGANTTTMANNGDGTTVQSTLDGGQIAGIVIGCLFGFWCVVCVFLLWRKRAEGEGEKRSSQIELPKQGSSHAKNPSKNLGPDSTQMSDMYKDDEVSDGEPIQCRVAPVTRSQKEAQLRTFIAQGRLKNYGPSDLKLTNKIGEGTYKLVYAAIAPSRDGHEEAVAVCVLKAQVEAHLPEHQQIQIKDKLTCSLIDEALVSLKVTEDPNVVDLKGVCFESLSLPNGEMASKSGVNLAFVFELAIGSLYEVLYTQKKKFTEAEKKRILYQILRGLCHLHANALTHRDLKTMNILMNENYEPKLADFGTVKEQTFDESMMSTMHHGVGTVRYMAPEQLPKSLEVVYRSQLRDAKVKVLDKADIWAFGCIMVELFTEVPPWSEPRSFDVPRSNKKSWVPPEALRFIDDETQDAAARATIKQCFQFDLLSRPAASVLEMRLRQAGWNGGPRNGSNQRTDRPSNEGQI